MPEMIEVEAYRELAERALDRTIAKVDASDAWFLKGGADSSALADALTDRTVTDARRIGKLLLLDTDGPTLGLRFGMTGRLLVDDAIGVNDLQYASHSLDTGWDRVRQGDDDALLSSGLYADFRAHNQISFGVRRGAFTFWMSEDFTPGPNPHSVLRFLWVSNAPDLVMGIAYTMGL